MASTFDFIVVGGGPAGSAVASGLVRTAKQPTVLLLEAGGDNSDRNLRVDGQRWTTFQNEQMNWGYKTVPQEHCNNREIDYSRGKGLGGSSAINFGVYTVGSRDDYDEWARIVDDKTFEWERVWPRIKRLETFHGETPSEIDTKYATSDAISHGSNGALHVGYAKEWEKDLPSLLDVFEQAGFPLNSDHNSGNPLGMSVLINSSYGGLRTTAADLLMPVPDNLTIITNELVQRVLYEGKRVVGVETNGREYRASKEVILSTGALDTPKILMHSGIGPANQLAEYDIPLVLDNPAIGQGLRDHAFIPIVYSRNDNSTDRRAFYGSQEAMDAALEQWKKDGSGHWSKFACETGIGWFKSDRIVSSAEFNNLPVTEQTFLRRGTIPHLEFFTHFPIHWFIPGFPAENLNYSCMLAFLYNAQARGEVTLQSADPTVPLRFDPKFLSHPFDRRAATETTREILRVTKHPAFAKDNVAEIAVPKSDSDEDILEYWKQFIGSSWHMTGTAKMGKPGDVDSVVDKDFRILGVDGLRVADMSVVPVLPSCHTQAVAYITGATCAEKLVVEYSLA